MTKDMNHEVASAITTAVNCFCDPKKVVEYMTYEHRTLQQTFTRVCVEWLKTLSQTEYCDDRNRASVELAKKLMSIPEARDLLDTAHLPMI